MIEDHPTVERRDIHFDLSGVDLLNWHPAGRQVTSLFNTLSLLFPDGERFFIQSVRHYESHITDPGLKKQVKGFIGQEAMHGREHQAYNDALEAEGLPAKAIQEQVLGLLKMGHKLLSPRAQLAITIALEHFTAILADALLSDDRVLGGADPKMASMWRWHAIEETEHKAVAYDVYQQFEGGFWGYIVRCWFMLTISFEFLQRSFRFHKKMNRGGNIHKDKKARSNFYRFLFREPGILLRIIPAWLGYFKPGFHPWKHDNSAHIERWKLAYADEGESPSS